MIAYLDASALVKRYVVEAGSRETIALTADSEMTATSIVTRAEVAAALARAVRTRLLTQDRARSAQRSFVGDWPDLVRVPVRPALAERAEALAWSHGLRGYDLGDDLLVDVQLRRAVRFAVLARLFPDELHAERVPGASSSLETNRCSGGMPRKL